MASYKVSQENGQRKYGPPLGWRGAPPPRGSEVYVSRIPRNLREDCLIPIFSSIGTIYTLRLMMDFSGSNRGFCFIQYTSVEEANRAIVELDGFELVPEHQIKVCRSVDNRRLFLGQIPKDKTKQEIFDALSSIVSGVVDIILFISASDKRFNKGFCFAEFETHRAAAMARRTLVVNGLRFWNREVRIDWAMPEIFVEDSVMAKVTTIHIRNVLAETSEADLKNIIYNFANREDVVKLRKIRDFAFVNINTREAAERVFEGLKSKSLMQTLQSGVIWS
ncbi:hypothetical protein AAG570_006997 [Ranatra chinensis]|uniref:RRM domain-containing protein n=1 Tax=Ranatra chinensis TaxID=642074 RepID=A0ABD0YVX9_9HEMI